MDLGERIIGLLVGSALLTFWLILDGVTAWTDFLVSQDIEVPLGEGGILFSGFIIIGLGGIFGTYLILWSVRRRKGVT